MSTPHASLEIALGDVLLRTTSDAILVADDTNWRVVAFNEAAVRLYGGTTVPLVGAAVETLFRLDGESAVERAMWKARTEPDGLQTSLETPDGSRIVRVRARRCETIEGSICVISLQDLTEIEQLSAELARSRAEQQALLDEFGIGFLVLDSNGKVLRHNSFPPLEEAFGTSVTGRNFFLDVARGEEARPVFQRYHEWVHGYEREPYRETFDLELGRRICEAEMHVGAELGIGTAVVRLIDTTTRRRTEEQLRLQAFQAEESARHAAIAAETAQRLFASLDRETLLENAAVETCRVFGASLCQLVHVQDDATLRVMREASWSGPVEPAEFDTSLDANPMIAEVIRVLQPIGIDAVANHPLAGQAGLLTSVGARSSAAAPISVNRELRGVILIHQRDRSRNWVEPELALLGTLATQIGLALDNAAQYLSVQTDRDRSREIERLVDATRDATDLDSLLDASASFFETSINPSIYAVIHPALHDMRVWSREGDSLISFTPDGDQRNALQAMAAVLRNGGSAGATVFEGREAMLLPLPTSAGETGALVLVCPSDSLVWDNPTRGLAERAAHILGPELSFASLLGIVISAKYMWEKTFDAMSDGIVVHDSSLNIVRVNRAFARLMRVSPAKIVGSRLPSVLEETNREIVERACERVASTRRPYTFDIDEPAIGGTVSISISPLRIAEGDFFIHTIRDITDQRHMQERLSQASRMASIGRLATGVAHEINTPLATITGCAQSLSRQLASIAEITDLPKWSTVNERLNTIVEQSFRCKKITRDLLDFAKPNKPSLVACDLARVATEAIETADRDRESGRIGLKVTGDAWQASTDPDLVRQILINLIVNAIDASGEKARVLVEARFLKRLARLSVRDRGKGIAPNELERIFDPFYTTKAPGKGTGLGLSISQSLAISLGGRLDVTSEAGRGSRFTLTLPREPRGRSRS